MKFAQIVMGPAGTGKSTYCKNIQEHCKTLRRKVHVINLDPAADHFGYSLAADIRDLISVEDVMEELDLGPNGGLMYCMDYMLECRADWLDDILGGFGDEDYVLFDCPGQIELYSHVPIMRSVARLLQSDGWNAVGVYLIDATFASDAAKLLSGNLAALAAMMHLELPHLNVLTKCDIVKKDVWGRFLSPSGVDLLEELSASTPSRFKSLNGAMAKLLDDFSMVQFLPLDPTDEDSLELVLGSADRLLQYGEDMEPRHMDRVDGAMESMGPSASLGGMAGGAAAFGGDGGVDPELGIAAGGGIG